MSTILRIWMWHCKIHNTEDKLEDSFCSCRAASVIGQCALMSANLARFKFQILGFCFLQHDVNKLA